MNTLKSGTTIVVLLGVLYGVYVVLSKPDRLREFPLPGSSTAATSDPGPTIEFGTDASAGAGHAEPHLAVETGAPTGLGVADGSPASPALPSPVPAPAELSRTGVPGSGAVAAAGSGYGPSAYGSASDNAGPTGSGTGYGGGSRYNISSGSSGSLSDNGSSPSYADQRGYIGQTSGQDPSGDGLAQPVQRAYDSGASVSPGAGTNLSDSSAEVRSDALTEYSVRQMWAQAEQLVAEEKFKDALAVLSSHYSNPSLPNEHREAMAPWLDALAARVIYSKQHLLELPYEARAKETLFDIQERFNVPWQLLQNINADVVKDPQVVVVGTPLKVVKGPFRADVDLARSQLTVYLNELYAGRFPITIGNEPPRPGRYKIVDKRLDRVYYGKDGQTISSSDPSNPYGGVWMDLGQEMSIHGSPLQPTGGAALGCISLSPQDAKDVYGILSLSSEVVIR